MPPTPGLAAPNSPATAMRTIIAMMVCQFCGRPLGPTGSWSDETGRVASSVSPLARVASHSTTQTVFFSPGGTISETVTLPSAEPLTRTFDSLPRS